MRAHESLSSVPPPPWPFWGAAAAPAEAAVRGSWRRQAPLGDAGSHSTLSHGSPCSDAEWRGTFPFPLRHTGGAEKCIKHLKKGQHRVTNSSFQTLLFFNPPYVCWLTHFVFGIYCIGFRGCSSWHIRIIVRPAVWIDYLASLSYEPSLKQHVAWCFNSKSLFLNWLHSAICLIRLHRQNIWGGQLCFY